MLSLILAYRRFTNKLNQTKPNRTIMKITKLFFLSLVVILFSCDKEEDPLPTSEGMEGEWTITGINYSGTTTTSAFGLSATVNHTGTGKNMDLTTTFTRDPNTVASEGSYTIEVKNTALGQTVTEELHFTEVLIDGTWTLEGRTLTIANTGIEQEATVTRQTSTALELRININESETAQGTTVATNIQIVYTFQKN